jgi:sulfite reductase alpha subunit-like flavoprotein
MMNMGVYKPEDLAAEKNLLAIISTYGEGEPPAAAEELFEYLQGPDVPRLEQLRFAVLALGDKQLHSLLQGRGRPRCDAGGCWWGQRISERVDADLDFHADAARWTKGVFQAILPHKAGEIDMPVEVVPSQKRKAIRRTILIGQQSRPRKPEWARFAQGNVSC